MSKKIIVTGIGTDVGKTVVAAILTKALDGEYWKPIQCGPSEDSDTECVAHLLDSAQTRIHAPAYTFQTPCSPHAASKLEKKSIDPFSIQPQETRRPLIIETAGGVLVPLDLHTTMLDLFQTWQASWVIVSKHYVGSINHTLLTLEALKARNIDVQLLIFNGEKNESSIEAICTFSKITTYLELAQEKRCSKEMVDCYAKKWKRSLVNTL